MNLCDIKIGDIVRIKKVDEHSIPTHWDEVNWKWSRMRWYIGVEAEVERIVPKHHRTWIYLKSSEKKYKNINHWAWYASDLEEVYEDFLMDEDFEL